MNYFATNVKFLREKRGLKQNEIASQLDFKPTTWNGYETGKSQPYIDGIIRISEYFNVTESELLHVDLNKEHDFSQLPEEGKKRKKYDYNGDFQGDFVVKKYTKNEQSGVVNEGTVDYKITEGIKEKDMLQLIELITNLSMKIAEYIDTNKKITELEIRLTQIEKLLIKPKK